MNRSSWREELIRRSSDWIDTDSDIDGQSPASLSEHESRMDERELICVADQQFIDAMLFNMSDEAQQEKESRIRRVMEAIQPIDVTPAPRMHLGRWQPLFAVAACLTVACTLFWIQFSRESGAGEVLRQIREVSLENTDRVYNLRRVAAVGHEQDEHQAKLYLRGVEGFALVCGDNMLGRNGDEFWFVSAKGDVVVADSFGWMAAELGDHNAELELLRSLSIQSRHVPLMQLASVVDLMQHDYDVSLRSGLEHGQHDVDELMGRRRGTSTDLPSSIRLWSGTDSRIIHRAELIWQTDDDPSRNNALILELSEADDVPSDWYEHRAHHPSDAPVRRIMNPDTF